jgi:hypothetical protein
MPLFEIRPDELVAATKTPFEAAGRSWRISMAPACRPTADCWCCARSIESRSPLV